MVPEKILAAIGDITVSFALVEGSMQTLVGSFIREHQRVGQIITAELSFRGLRALAISLYVERHGEDDDDLVTLRNLMRRAGELEALRNEISHSLWAAGKSPDTVSRVKMTAKEKHGLRFQWEEVTEQRLRDVAASMQTLADDIMQLFFRLIRASKAVNNPIARQW